MKLHLKLMAYFIIILQLINSVGSVHAQTAIFEDGYFGCNSSMIGVNAPHHPAFAVVGGNSLNQDIVTYTMYVKIYYYPKNGTKWTQYDWMGPATAFINHSVGINGIGPDWYLEDGTKANTQTYSISSPGWYQVRIAIYDPKAKAYEYHWAKNPTAGNPNNVMCKNF